MAEWIQEWDWQYQEYQKIPKNNHSQINHSWYLLMEQRLLSLQDILGMIISVEKEI
ncbi:hypothetical protein RINTHH_21090 [Richelia intracellularis HH01]|uniref:Uncharacterized protein n=1 Tax=Richelia intracellularis HH01 TaxID=1165094 RepID=M1WTP8_9NOST|nr:hypothetical protein [Richelia intracellularis]CCH68264.1 hypothetical protein RINTHH_21090 [Richelia intracellularis HH01]